MGEIQRQAFSTGTIVCTTSNRYVADASFFPTSSGTNPSLIIAANALRVAEVILGRKPASRAVDGVVTDAQPTN
ncbi:hypothetical protein X766_08850 [Mesorhizobium sp. LSJC255A00]|uniref:GMC oxidoreductase n=1 Tax=unclassified Mesorhizobium TaxID=325217 RepID=UPI0003CE31DE|nr:MULTISPECIES: GMC oxidoreductase [unclassified Mesorhizobium]ESX20329.1 hypothetical protein X766_08850 [Mesorhizobium sp. LSJC255A00]ESX78430.1 hypothetical protein X757_08060 [Mesorhizobium sp. LSHC414A00]